MSKEMYKQRLVTLRTQIELERSLKKADNERFAKQIKATTLQAAKDSYRKMKIARAAAHDRRIESLKKEMERTREMMKRAK
ncbi:MAG: hypothetical protein E7091_04250 [Bacteroidales bacterium]|nr:hypothetical protein [Bacteroidales bacterium]